jgi:hypothetical protein
MAATNYTPISLYYSTTVSATPTAGNLTNGELAINITDGKLFYKDNGGTVQTIAYKNTPLSTVTGTLPVANGGTNGTATPTAGGVSYGTGSAYAFTSAGTSGQVLTSNGSSAPTWAAAPAGGITYTRVTSTTTLANNQGVIADTTGGAFTVNLPASPSTGAQVWLADGGAWGTNNLTVGRNGSTIEGVAQDLVCDITGVGVQMLYDGTTWQVYAQAGAFSNSFTGTGSVVLATSPTISSPVISTIVNTGTLTLPTSTDTLVGRATTDTLTNKNLQTVSETVTISATAATGTINYDVSTQSVLYYTTNASANWTTNFRGSSGTSLNSLMSTGQSITVAFLVTQGGTAYYNNAFQVDGASVTPKWQGGTAPSAGNASSIDIYSFTIVKTGNAAFTIFASQTKFA